MSRSAFRFVLTIGILYDRSLAAVPGRVSQASSDSSSLPVS